MATAIQLPQPASDTGAPLDEVARALVSPNGHSHSKSNSYSQRLTLTEFDLRDDRYPSLSSSKSPVSPPAHSPSGGFDPALDAGMTAALRASYEKSRNSDPVPLAKSWIGENITQEPVEEWADAQNGAPATTLEPQSPRGEDTTRSRGSPIPPVGSYNSSFAARPSGESAGEPRLAYADPAPLSPDMGQQTSSPRLQGDQGDVAAPGSPNPANASILTGAATSGALLSPSASPRHPSYPTAGIGAGPSSSSQSPIVPLSAGPAYNAAIMQIPISPKTRAYPQHPTYITPTTSPAMQPSFSPPQVPKEEICVECAMRDQDMADVDVTSPGVWDRESDILYEELCRREAEEDVSGRSSSDNHSRPRAKGGRLTEENLRFWLSIVRLHFVWVWSAPLTLSLLEPQRTLVSPTDTRPVCEVATAVARGRGFGPCTSAERISVAGREDARYLLSVAPLCVRDGQQFPANGRHRCCPSEVGQHAQPFS